MTARQIGRAICRHQRTRDGKDSGNADTLAVSGISGTTPARREPTEHDTLGIDAIIAVVRFDKAYGLGDVVEPSLHESRHIARLDRWQAHLGAHETDARHRHLVGPRKHRFAARLRVHLREPVLHRERGPAQHCKAAAILGDRRCSTGAVGEDVAFLRSSMKNAAVSEHKGRRRCAGGNGGQISVELKRHNLHRPVALIVADPGMSKDDVTLGAGAHDALPSAWTIRLIPHTFSHLCIQLLARASLARRFACSCHRWAHYSCSRCKRATFFRFGSIASVWSSADDFRSSFRSGHSDLVTANDMAACSHGEGVVPYSHAGDRATNDMEVETIFERA